MTVGQPALLLANHRTTGYLAADGINPVEVWLPVKIDIPSPAASTIMNVA
jgi:hypothetical protein